MISVHRKITHAFTALIGITSVLASLAFLDLWLLEKRIEHGMVITTLETLIQDMRREEKNLFLYRDTDVHQYTLFQINTALTTLQTEQTALLAVSSPTELLLLYRSLVAYQIQLQHYAVVPTISMEPKLRVTGHMLTQLTAHMVETERRDLSQALSQVRWIQAVGVIGLVGLFIAIGYWLDQAVIHPLKRLEADLTPIIEGRFDRLPAGESTTEIVSLRNAFNRLLDELQYRQSRLLQSEKLAALGVLSAGIAHELNNPLSNISSSCQLLLEELDAPTHPQWSTWAHTIDSETERARRIVDALLNFGRRQDSRMHSLNLLQLVTDTQLLLQGYLRKTQSQCSCQIPADLQVTGDAPRLQQVFINLIRNAAESGIQTHITLHAQICTTPPRFSNTTLVVGETTLSRQWVKLTLSDTGQGISETVLPHIFEPFYTTRPPRHGMGLGLYIVHEIIQEHRGCIAVNSTLNHGTTFTLCLPMG